ncbi:MAG: hypothetical protein GC157_01155 [Frankiales bacterium]|nr:hypothetical protein [Frankiales bacterium]
MPAPAVPEGLSDDARDLFLDVLEADPELDAHRFHALVQACRLISLADTCEASIGESVTVPGYRGQPVANPLIGEARLARAAAVVALKAAGLTPTASSASAAGAALVRKRWASR